MGIYVFNRDVIRELLDNPLSDFGKHIIPHAIKTHRVFSYVFQGYWEDIGTIRSFFEANLDLVSELPRFNFFDMSAPIFSRPRYLPGSKINGAQIDHAVISDGCIINHARINQQHRRRAHRRRRGHGIEPRHHPRLRLLRIAKSPSQKHEREGKPRIGIGANCQIENAIIDKNARIGNNVTISPAGKAGQRGPRTLLHPRRHRHHSQKRRHPARNGDLSLVGNANGISANVHDEQERRSLTRREEIVF